MPIAEPPTRAAGRPRKKYNPDSTVNERPASVSIVPLGWLVTAMKKLSGRQVRVLIELFAQMRRFDRRKSHRSWVTISYSELAFLAEMDRPAIWHAIKALNEAGYLVQVKPGKGRGDPSRMQMWLPPRWKEHLMTKEKVRQDPADKKYPADHHFISKLDLVQFRKALDAGLLPARVYAREEWLARMLEGHVWEHEHRRSWVTPAYRYERGLKLLAQVGVTMPRPDKSPKQRWHAGAEKEVEAEEQSAVG